MIILIIYLLGFIASLLLFAWMTCQDKAPIDYLWFLIGIGIAMFSWLGVLCLIIYEIFFHYRAVKERKTYVVLEITYIKSNDKIASMHINFISDSFREARYEFQLRNIVAMSYDDGEFYKKCYMLSS